MKTCINIFFNFYLHFRDRTEIYRIFFLLIFKSPNLYQVKHCAIKHCAVNISLCQIVEVCSVLHTTKAKKSEKIPYNHSCVTMHPYFAETISCEEFRRHRIRLEDYIYKIRRQTCRVTSYENFISHKL
jgi:hypothetical protein